MKFPFFDSFSTLFLTFWAPGPSGPGNSFSTPFPTLGPKGPRTPLGGKGRNSDENARMQRKQEVQGAWKPRCHISRADAAKRGSATPPARRCSCIQTRHDVSIGNPFACYATGVDFGPFGPKVDRKKESENKFPGPLGPGGPKSPKRSRKRVEIVKTRVDFGSFSTPFWTFWAPEAERPRGLIFGPFFDFGPEGPK